MCHVCMYFTECNDIFIFNSILITSKSCLDNLYAKRFCQQKMKYELIRCLMRSEKTVHPLSQIHSLFINLYRNDGSKINNVAL